MPIVTRSNTTYNLPMHGVRYCMLAIVLAFTLSVLAESENEEVTHVPQIAPAAVNRAFQDRHDQAVPFFPCLGCHKPGAADVDSATKTVTLPWKRTMAEEELITFAVGEYRDTYRHEHRRDTKHEYAAA